MLTYTPLLLAENGGTAMHTGLVAATYALGFMFGCLRSLPLIGRVGYIRAFAAAAGTSALIIMVLTGVSSPWLWAILRFIMGMALAMLFTTADAWLSISAPDHMRGRILSVNSIAVGVMAIASQLMVANMSQTPDRAFEVLIAILLFAVVILCMTHSMPPRIDTDSKMSPLKVWRASPIAVLGAFVSGAVTSSLLTIIPFTFSQAGASPSLTAGLIACLYTGRLLFQWPIGSLSDKWDRRWLIAACAGSIALISITTILLDPFQSFESQPLQFTGFLFAIGTLLIVVGGLCFPLYSLCVGHAFERKVCSGVSISTSLLLMWAVGSVAGPLLISFTSILMEKHSSSYVIGGLCLVLTLFTLWRLHQQPPAATVIALPYMMYPSAGLGISK